MRGLFAQSTACKQQFHCPYRAMVASRGHQAWNLFRLPLYEI
jgi:hypothetical protein